MNNFNFVYNDIVNEFFYKYSFNDCFFKATLNKTFFYWSCYIEEAEFEEYPYELILKFKLF